MTPVYRQKLINKAKTESSKKGRFSLVIESRLREFMRFENGEMTFYDITGKEKGQIILSLEELKTIKEMENASFTRKKQTRTMQAS